MQDENKRLDETIPGGTYIKDGVVVDANGEPREGWTVGKDGSIVPPGRRSESAPAKESTPVNPFADLETPPSDSKKDKK